MTDRRQARYSRTGSQAHKEEAFGADKAGQGLETSQAGTQVTAHRVITANREGQAGHSKEPRQAAKAGGHGKQACRQVSEGKKGGRVSKLTKSAKCGRADKAWKVGGQGTRDEQ